MTVTGEPATERQEELLAASARLDKEPLGGHPNVDAAYECESGIDQCWRHTAVALLRASRAAAEGDAGALRAALTDANSIIAMTRRHLAEDHPDCAYTALGVMNDASRAALAAASPEPLDALAEALRDQSRDENLSPKFRKGIEFAAGYVDAWASAPDDDPVKRRFRDKADRIRAASTAATPAAGEPGE